MDNHIMYFYDGHGELALTRCCLCELMYYEQGEMECRCGYDCLREECVAWVPVEKKKVTDRVALIRETGKQTDIVKSSANV